MKQLTLEQAMEMYEEGKGVSVFAPEKLLVKMTNGECTLKALLEQCTFFLNVSEKQGVDEISIPKFISDRMR